MTTIIAKLLFSLVLTAMMFVTWLWRTRLTSQFTASRIASLLILVAASRVGLLALVFLVFGSPMSGNSLGYWENVTAVHQGLVPFRDFGSPFATPYNPLFYYLIAVAQSPFQLALLFSGFELLLFAAAFLLYRDMLQPQALWFWSIMYALSPLNLWWSGVGGQEDVLTPLFYLAALLVLLGLRRPGASGFIAGSILGAGFLVTKTAFVLPGLFFLRFVRRRFWLFVGGLVSLGVFLPLLLTMGPNLLHYTISASSTEGVFSAPSTWILLNTLLQGSINLGSALPTAFMLLTVLAVSLWLLNRRGKRAAETNALQHRGSLLREFTAGWVLVWMAFGLTTAIGHSSYLMFSLFAILALWALRPNSRLLTAAVLAVHLLANVQSSVYYQQGSPLHYDLSIPAQSILLLMDLAILGCYLVFAGAGLDALQDIGTQCR